MAQLIHVTAIRKRYTKGPYKGLFYTEFYKPGIDTPYATWPASIEQPRYGTRTISLNCWVWCVTWMRG